MKCIFSSPLIGKTNKQLDLLLDMWNLVWKYIMHTHISVCNIVYKLTVNKVAAMQNLRLYPTVLMETKSA
jgi:hypothetical protein